MEHRSISWEALEHEHGEHSSDWYWILGVVAVSLAVLFAFFDNYLLAIIILLGAFAAALNAHRGPQIMYCELSARGVIINNKAFPYAHLDSFWIDHYTRTPKVLFKSNKAFSPFIIMPLGEADEDMIREFLSQYLDEEEHTEPAIQKLLEHLGF